MKLEYIVKCCYSCGQRETFLWEADRNRRVIRWKAAWGRQSEGNVTPAEPRPLQPCGIRARRQIILLGDFSFVHVVVHNCTLPVCLRHVDLSRSGTDSGPACAARWGLQSPMQNSDQTRFVLAAPPGGRSGRSGEFKRVITLHLRVFQRGNLLT